MNTVEFSEEVNAQLALINELHEEVRHLTILLLSDSNGICQDALDSLRRIESFPDVEDLIIRDMKTRRYYLAVTDVIKLLGK